MKEFKVLNITAAIIKAIELTLHIWDMNKGHSLKKIRKTMKKLNTIIKTTKYILQFYEWIKDLL